MTSWPSAVKAAEAALGETGRVLLRPSGTEPVVRVMVEAADEETAQSIAEHLAEVVRRNWRWNSSPTSGQIST